MTMSRSIIAGIAFLLCTTGILNAQTPPETTPPADKTIRSPETMTEWDVGVCLVCWV
jgi:hypothetical protein